MAVKTIDPANDLIQGFDVSDGTPAEGTVYEFVKAALASGQAINLDYNPSTGRITINPRIASAAEVNAGVANNALLTPGNLGGLSRLSNLAENLRKAIGLQVQRNGASQGTRGALNLIPGTGINIAVSDDTANDRVNATISMASGGTGVWIGSSFGGEHRGVIAAHSGGNYICTFATPQPDTNYTVVFFYRTQQTAGWTSADGSSSATVSTMSAGIATTKSTTQASRVDSSGFLSPAPLVGCIAFR